MEVEAPQALKQEPAPEPERPIPQAGPPPEASTSGVAQQPFRPRLPARRFTLLELIQMGGGFAAKEQLDMLQNRLRQGAILFQPTICKPRSTTLRELEYLDTVGVQVADWTNLRTAPPIKTNRPINLHSNPVLRGGPQRTKAPQQHHGGSGKVGNAMKLLRAVKSKANGSGRTYTSRYRGVHQTFPTKRWEAQFRRNGKPTSLGCFDHEEEAARAYDKMMLWCELHNAAGVKSGITNFDPTEYEKEFAWLQSITQDELIETLRSEGRRQAAHRMMRQKREGQADPNSDDYDDPPQQQQQQPPVRTQHQQQQLVQQMQQQMLLQQQQQQQMQQMQQGMAAGSGVGGGGGGGGGSGVVLQPPVSTLLQMKPELGMGLQQQQHPAAQQQQQQQQVLEPTQLQQLQQQMQMQQQQQQHMVLQPQLTQQLLLQQLMGTVGDGGGGGRGGGGGGGGTDGISGMQVEVVTGGESGGDVDMGG